MVNRLMKNSGIEWIGEIPKNWNLIQLGRIGTFTASGINKKIDKSEEFVKIVNYVDVYRNKKMIIDNSIVFMEVTTTPKRIKEKLLQIGDIIFTPSSETIDEIGRSAVVFEEIDNLAFSYHVLRLKLNVQIDLSFKKYMTNNHFLYNYFSSRAVGTVRKTLNRNDFKIAPVLIPPFKEQQKISSFLDEKVAHIDALLEDTKKSIENLKSYKQSLFTETIKKGLNPNVDMKDSGIEWIGDIPKHWKLTKLKYILTNEKNSIRVGPFGSHLKNTDIVEEGKWVYNQRLILDNNYLTNDTFITDKKYQSMIAFQVEHKDILLTTRGTIGKISRVPEKFKEGIIHSSVIKFRIDENKFKYKLLEYLFNESSFIKEQIVLLSNATTIEVIYSNTLKNVYVPVPPLREQVQILNFLNDKNEHLKNILEEKERLIFELELYKRSLIYEYVTGKKVVE